MYNRFKVIFALDYSGSMSGNKIRSAVENIKNIFDNYIDENDYISVVTFNGFVMTNLPLTIKRDNEISIGSTISSLIHPNGGTAFYLAIDETMNMLEGNHTQNDWIVALTDGEDNCSKSGQKEKIIKRLSSSDNGLVIIGVGQDVQTNILEEIAHSSIKGFSSIQLISSQ